VAKQSEAQAERAESVILIAELRNFTRMSEMLEPDRVLALADQFFECAAHAVAANGGESMAVHNDSLMAVFRNAAVADTARAAVHALKYGGLPRVADDLAAARRWYSEFLGIEPYFNRPEYIEFRFGDYYRLAGHAGIGLSRGNLVR